MSSRSSRVKRLSRVAVTTGVAGVILAALSVLLVCDKKERSNPLDPANVGCAPGKVADFQQDLVIGWYADWDTKTIALTWRSVAGAAGYGYKILAHDNFNNPDYVEIHDEPSQDHLMWQAANVTLPTQFDRYQGDGIQTPLTDSTVVTFVVVAYNECGDGPVSDSVTVKDQKAPGGAILVQTYGSADNTTGSFPANVGITLEEQLEYCERTNNSTWSFVEGGGDEDYVLDTTGNVFWEWTNDARKDLYAGFSVPAGACAAGDWLTLYISDNWGNTGYYYPFRIRLRPFIDITDPVATSTDVEASTAGYPVVWTTVQPPGYDRITELEVVIRYKGEILENVILPSGETVPDNGDGGSFVWHPNDTLYDATCRIGLRDHNGGVIWWSEEFVHSGINFADLAALHSWDDSTVYDRGGTDSTAIPLVWNSEGIDSVEIWYSVDDSMGGYILDTTIENTGAFDWYPPDKVMDYRTWIMISDADSDHRPRVQSVTGIAVTHDPIIIFQKIHH